MHCCINRKNEYKSNASVLYVQKNPQNLSVFLSEFESILIACYQPEVLLMFVLIIAEGHPCIEGSLFK